MFGKIGGKIQLFGAVFITHIHLYTAQPFENQQPNIIRDIFYEPIADTQDSWGGFRVRGKSLLWSSDGFARRYYINMFLGVPYATAPIGNLRFRNPLRPRGWLDEFGRKSDFLYDATYYRNACPQNAQHLQSTLTGRVNISEDCLYMNIFVPNITFLPHTNQRYPVMVFFHGGAYQHGSAQEWPGFELAKRNVMVVTVNYRLGPFGFLTTEDEYSRGNFGLLDQKLALEYIQDNIHSFFGDKNRVTIFGEDAGAASVGLHLLSPLTRDVGLYHRAIAMSGSDLCEWAVIPANNRPREYAYQLARKLNCEFMDHRRLVECLRKNRNMQDIIDAAGNVTRKSWTHAGPWAPVVDGSFLPLMPKELRERGLMSRVMYMSGVTKDEGAWMVKKHHFDHIKDQELLGGLTTSHFQSIVDKFLENEVAQFAYEEEIVYRQLTPGIDPFNMDYAKDSLKFEYTYWVNKNNDTARGQMLINMYSDKLYGAGVDEALKYHVKYNRTYAYVFGYRSKVTSLPLWMGVPHGGLNPYVFGFPLMNNTVRQMFNLKHKEMYDLRDGIVSDVIMHMWTNFTTSGNSTPYGVRCYHYPEWWYRLFPEGILPWNLDQTTRQILQRMYPNEPWLWDQDPNRPGVYKPWQCNITWPAYNIQNLTYLNLENDTYERYNYHQGHYAFWREFFPSLIKRLPATLKPTPEAIREYQIATFSLATAVFVILIVIIALTITLCRRHSY